MKKELLLHFTYLITFFLLITLYKSWFNLSDMFFWVGGVLGMFLPYLDHIIYAYFLRPYELNSQRIREFIKTKKIIKALNFAIDTKFERTKLIFNTVYFNLLFLILTLLVVTSSASLFGRGLVLGVCLHFLIAQISDLQKNGNLDFWMKEIPFRFEKRQLRLYLLVNALFIIYLGFFN